MEKFVITQNTGFDTFYFGKCSPSFYGFSLSKEGAFKFDTEEQATSFIENNGILDVQIVPLNQESS